MLFITTKNITKAILAFFWEGNFIKGKSFLFYQRNLKFQLRNHQEEEAHRTIVLLCFSVLRDVASFSVVLLFFLTNCF